MGYVASCVVHYCLWPSAGSATRGRAIVPAAFYQLADNFCSRYFSSITTDSNNDRFLLRVAFCWYTNVRLCSRVAFINPCFSVFCGGDILGWDSFGGQGAVGGSQVDWIEFLPDPVQRGLAASHTHDYPATDKQNYRYY